MPECGDICNMSNIKKIRNTNYTIVIIIIIWLMNSMFCSHLADKRIISIFTSKHYPHTIKY